MAYAHLFSLRKMQAFIIINEIIKIAVLLYCFGNLAGRGKKESLQTGMALAVIAICFVMKLFFRKYIFLGMLVEAVSLALYVRICYSIDLLEKYMYLFMLYVIMDLLHLVIAIAGFPLMVLLHFKPRTIGAEVLILILQVFLYIGLILWSRRINLSFVKRMSKISQMGMLFIFFTGQCIMLELRHLGYSRSNVVVYKILLFAVVFGFIVLALWNYDKHQEQKKMQDLTAYSHHTREIIPSMGRALEKIGEMSEDMEEVGQIIEELRAICNTDGRQTTESARAVKSFESTGIIALDLQLERYLEEAEAQDFTLDIIVRAPVKDILKNKDIEIYSLLQIVGDLYRNANKIVKRSGSGGRILMCFGYNPDGFYELSIYDNGDPFPEYVLEHLGERGVTTGGTGHGLSDVFESMHRGKMSFLLNQLLPKESIFTKGICITFDGRENITVNSR